MIRREPAQGSLRIAHGATDDLTPHLRAHPAGLVIPMVLILLTLVFFLMRVAPGDPVSAALGGRLSPKALEERRHAGGYDKPILVQYVDYLGDVVRLDFGKRSPTTAPSPT